VGLRTPAKVQQIVAGLRSPALGQAGEASDIEGDVLFAVPLRHQMLAKLMADYYAAWAGAELDP
jgi:hypothetical protein